MNELFSTAALASQVLWDVLLLQDPKIWKESQFWWHLGLNLKFKGQKLGYLSPILLEAKFGAKAPDLFIWKYPPEANPDPNPRGGATLTYTIYTTPTYTIYTRGGGQLPNP